MSKGEIIDSLGGGRYRIKLLYATDKIDAELVRINTRVAELAVLIPGQKLLVIELKQASQATVSEINNLIPQYRESPQEFSEQITVLQVKMARQRSDMALAVYQKDVYVLENLSLLKQRQRLEKAPKEKVMDAWCADFTEELNGIVGIADINDEPGQGVVIRPGFTDDAQFIKARDGGILPNAIQSGPQIYFNYAVLPGVQKWRPRYRIGVISKLAGDICTITLDDAFSSAQDLPINKTPILNDVPIEYMDCNGAAFDDGDRALVSFTSSGPLVIGFEKEPESCRLLRFAFEPSLAVTDGYNVFTAFRKWFGSPFTTNDGAEINPPLGTELGGTPVWTMTNKGKQISIEKGKSANYGNQNWISKDSEVISWDGPPGRTHDHAFASRNPEEYPYNVFQNFRQRWMTSGKVYHKLSVILELSSQPAAGIYSQVLGAGVRIDSLGQRWLMIVGAEKFFEIGAVHRIMQVRLDESYEVVGSLEIVMSYAIPAGLGAISHWLFSESGEKAVLSIRDFPAQNADGILCTEARVVDFSIDLGLSEQVVYERQKIGELTDSFSTTSDRQKYTLTLETGDSVSSYRAGYRVFIYCDYVKDERVLCYIENPAFTSSRSKSEYLFVTGLPPIPDDGSLPTPGTNIYRENSSGSFEDAGVLRVVTDKGAVLAYSSERVKGSSFANHEVIQGDTSSSSTSTESVFTTLQVAFIDLRFGFCMSRESVSFKQDLLSGSVQLDGTNATLTETQSSSSSIRLRAYIKGQRTGEVIITDQSSSIPYEVPAKFIPGTISVPSNSNAQDFYSQFRLSAAGSTVGGFAYRSGGIKFVSIQFMAIVVGELKMIQYNEITGKANPVMDIIERNPDDDFYFHRVGLY